MALHYFGVFVWALFPLAAFMLAVILLPLPAFVQRPAQALVDFVLHISFSIGGFSFQLFHFVVFISALTFLCTSHGL